MDSAENPLSMKRVECKHCGAVWLNGKHYWTTGSSDPDSELNLAGLVCNTPYGGNEKCINPKKGMEGGQTWKQRMEFLDSQDFDGQNPN